VLILTIGTRNWEEEIAAIKAMLQKLTRRVKKRKRASSFKKRRPPKLTRKLKKWLAWAATKDSKRKEVVKTFVHSEAS